MTQIRVKSSLWILLPVLFFLFSRCDPDKGSLGSYHLLIDGTVINPQETIALGDTLHFQVTMPPTVTALKATGESRTETLQSLQKAFYGIRIYRVDTANHTIYQDVQDYKFHYYVSPGYQTNGCIQCPVAFPYLQQSPPYTSILHIIPEEEGLFYLEITEQEGEFLINDNFEGLMGVRADVPDNHLALISGYLDGIADAVAGGLQVYAFRVN